MLLDFGYLVLTHPENIPEMNTVTNDSTIEMSTIDRDNSNDRGNFTIEERDYGDEAANENRIAILSSEEDQRQRYEKTLETIRIRTMIHMGKFFIYNVESIFLF